MECCPMTLSKVLKKEEISFLQPKVQQDDVYALHDASFSVFNALPSRMYNKRSFHSEKVTFFNFTYYK